MRLERQFDPIENFSHVVQVPSRASRDPSRRRRILDAARRQFTQYGLKGTRLDAVAAEAGCAKGALYLEFADKVALLREVTDEVFSEIRLKFERDVLPLESPLDRLVATLRFAYDSLRNEPLFGRLLRDDPDLRVLRPVDDDVKAMATKAQIDELLGWLDEGIERGEIRPDVDREAIPFVVGVLRFTPQHLALGTLGMFPGDRVLEAILDLFRAGLAATPESESENHDQVTERG